MMVYHSPAKINLTLKILGKRPDGFHEIETLMTPTSLHDTITLTPSPNHKITVTCTDPTIPTDQRNLAYQAAQLFFQHTSINAGINIHIEKQIPHGGGLGGGSSNAATTLRALRDHYAPHIPDETLRQWIAPLGSDIPFFINPSPSLCIGKGDIITPPPPIPQGTHHALLIFPPFGVPTPWAYKTYAQNPSPAEESLRWHNFPLRNDLEPAVFSKYIILKTLKTWLRNQTHLGIIDALMSGSGSTIIAFTQSDPHLQAITSSLHKTFGNTFRVHPITF